MEIDAIGVLPTQTGGVTDAAPIGQEDFLSILLSQLRFQDPLEPVDNREFIAQLAQFSALEINRQQSEKVDTLLTLDNANQALNLLGRRVEVRGAQQSGVGTVSAISFATGQPRLTVQTSGATLLDVRLSSVNLVTQ